MPVPILDMPVGVSSASVFARRPEVVINTPYTKANEDSRYRFVDGFYESANSTFRSPIIQVHENDILRQAQQIVDRLNAILPKFAGVPHGVMREVSCQVLYILLSQGFIKTTFEKTPDDSLLVTGEWQGKTVFVDIFFDQEEPAGYETILSVYEGKKPLMSEAGTLEDIVGKLLGYAVSLPSQSFEIHYRV
ncbi:hypothetical protein [Spirosoma montaniterrae]|uniref:Uncharacterized protein n=1 Tax=Spirosoma montaniterrae TaxID=1178516 RepID=A0A1P9X050_9BACT|nr:hypothetical protein [Spirosoma montaniterrae]AQG81016.1 hypothetical protein AWR27_17825 [Spirosoma montaniterrae]